MAAEENIERRFNLEIFVEKLCIIRDQNHALSRNKSELKYRNYRLSEHLSRIKVVSRPTLRFGDDETIL